MNCPLEIRRDPDLLIGFCAGSLGAEEAEQVRLHVDSCPRCGSFCRAQNEVWTALDAFEPAPVSPDFTRRLYRSIEAERGGFWRQFRARWGTLAPARPLAFASIIALALLLLQVPHRTGFQQQAAAEAIDADNVAQAIDDLDMIRQLSEPPQADETASHPM